MPAQKLTKGRLTQISVMLVVLLVVFFWRTFTFQPTSSFQCKSNSVCTFSVKNYYGKVIRTSPGSILINSTAPFTITTKQKNVNIIKEGSTWSISYPEGLTSLNVNVSVSQDEKNTNLQINLQ
ncbi:hypothetical protein [Vibrio marisflavi]|uniref:Uncharacterized protein n=1 Tax=Vibrio marisflavi CECT 7928 TaxID=634439 RepID=A0ABN8E3J6_9VIBR|nr:hypothetical protein [Vibrio marisflavi]CAH0539847.1 hypothetical protein VMF7928_02488 [Vibrio marisflavi CECT 7928]